MLMKLVENVYNGPCKSYNLSIWISVRFNEVEMHCMNEWLFFPRKLKATWHFLTGVNQCF